MIIVSQDKEKMVNFNNVNMIIVRENKIISFDNTFTDNQDGDLLGRYEDKERAKIVLQQIIKKYEEDSYYKRRYVGEGCYSVNEVNHPMPKVYYMPED